MILTGIEWGNVADWVSGIGSIGAILAVWWQSRQEKNLLKLQLQNEKEQLFQQRRQLFKINTVKLGFSKKNFYLPIDNTIGISDLKKIVKIPVLLKSQVDMLEISNISDKELVAVHVVFLYSNNNSIQFNIDNIKSHSKINLINLLEDNLYKNFNDIVHSEVDRGHTDERLLYLLEHIWDNQLEYDIPSKSVDIDGYDSLAKKIDHLFKRSTTLEIDKEKEIVVYYMTSIRERIRLVFKQNKDGIYHKKEFNMLEYKDGWVTKKDQMKFEIFDKEYNLNNFQESENFNISA